MDFDAFVMPLCAVVLFLPTTCCALVGAGLQPAGLPQLHAPYTLGHGQVTACIYMWYARGHRWPASFVPVLGRGCPGAVPAQYVSNGWGGLTPPQPVAVDEHYISVPACAGNAAPFGRFREPRLPRASMELPWSIGNFSFKLYILQTLLDRCYLL